MRRLVYCMAIRHGGDEEWDFAYQQYHLTSSGSEKDNLLYGMSCSKQPWVMNRQVTHIERLSIFQMLKHIEKETASLDITIL